MKPRVKTPLGYVPLPLIRCTVKPPCGHCWYCKEHEKEKLAKVAKP